MCWPRPRRTINPAYKSSADYLPSTQRLHFNWCVKASGFRNQESGKIICRFCYSRLPSQYAQSTYYYFFVHNLLYSTESPPLFCRICTCTLSTFQPVLYCAACYETHEVFNTIIAEQGRSIEDFENPFLIPINATTE